MVYLLHEDFPKIVNHLHVGCIPEMTRVVKAIEKSEYQLANLRISPIGGQPVYATTSNPEKERDSLFRDEQSIPPSFYSLRDSQIMVMKKHLNKRSKLVNANRNSRTLIRKFYQPVYSSMV